VSEASQTMLRSLNEKMAPLFSEREKVASEMSEINTRIADLNKEGNAKKEEWNEINAKLTDIMLEIREVQKAERQGER